jgi:Glycoside Hydrolase Family 113
VRLAGCGARLGPAVALAVTLGACGGSSSSPPAPALAPSSTPPPGGAFEYDGLTHVSWWHDEYDSADASASRAALAATGANWAGLLATWYMESRTSSAVFPDPQRTPTDDGVRRAIDEVHAAGLHVMLKPHVDPMDGAWRGQIGPGDPAAWFESYAAFVEHYATIAREKNVEMLCVGTELVTMTDSRYAGSWSTLIARLRAVYPGLLTYAANANAPGDELTSVSFWPQLDLLGLDVYTPLTDQTDPSRADLVAGWRRNRNGHDMVAAYRNLQAAHGKPVIFTEIGYRSADGTNRAPWDWQASARADPAEQADCYEAMYEVWSAESTWMKGLFWWSWAVPRPGAGDTGYEPWTKPAEDVLRQWQR